MKAIKIIWITDYDDCECCGCNFANGASIVIDDKVYSGCEPTASCFGGSDYTITDVMEYVYSLLDEVYPDNDEETNPVTLLIERGYSVEEQVEYDDYGDYDDHDEYDYDEEVDQ